MSQPVKKPYTSELRAAQARATRRAIVDAAARLFIQRGFGGTTVDAIAEAAGVSRKTVFASVGGKAQALKLAIDWAIVGDDEPVPVLERPFVQAGTAEADARRMVADFARGNVAIGARIARLVAVAEAAAGADAEIRALTADGHAQRLRGMTVFATVLASRGALRPGLTVSEAADILWLLASPGVYHRFVVEQRWSRDRFEEWLGDALTGLLIDPGYQPA
jgi:AcrR family transcriptional regulator